MVKLRNETGNESSVEVVATSGRRRNVKPDLFSAGATRLRYIDKNVFQWLESLLELCRRKRLLLPEMKYQGAKVTSLVSMLLNFFSLMHTTNKIECENFFWWDWIRWGQGKSTYMFSAQRQQISTFHLLALTTEAWRGAESGMLREPYMLIYPDPMRCHVEWRHFFLFQFDGFQWTPLREEVWLLLVKRRITP